MTAIEAYAPPRDLAAKVRRRMTQWRAARPADLRFEQPVLSISFDDFPRTAAESGARVLEAHGARGTYYASAGLANVEGACGLGFSGGDLRRLAGAGHEIGCHTYGHHDCARLDTFEALHDLARNRDALADMGYDGPLTTLAYPYGETSNALKDSLPPRYRSARGILPGVNAGRTDLAQLRAHALFGDDWQTRLVTALKLAAKAKGWVIGFTHDVSAAPSPWGTRADDLDSLIKAARAAGFVILPVSAALERAI